MQPKWSDQELAARIEGLMNGQRSLLAARRETRDGLITQLQQRAAQIDTQVERNYRADRGYGSADRACCEERATQADLLERGLAQAARVLSLDREAARLEGARGALLSERGSAAERQAEIAQQVFVAWCANPRRGANRAARHWRDRGRTVRAPARIARTGRTSGHPRPGVRLGLRVAGDDPAGCAAPPLKPALFCCATRPAACDFGTGQSV